jgi:glycosyltransferase involved in cell wall biosynthesis
MSTGDSIVEVRVPTFRRPQLLKRALSSLVAQSYPAWKAIVLDDSPQKEGEAVVREIGDARICYKPNNTNLGPDRNLNQAFRKAPYFDASCYFCILEDDNRFLPGLLAANVEALRQSRCGVMLRNQRCFYMDDSGMDILLPKTTLGSNGEEGVYQPLHFIPRMLFNNGLSNGALFWQRDCRTDFEIHFPTVTSVHQEQFRSWFLDEPVYFAAVPLSLFNASPARWSGPVRKKHDRLVNRGDLSIAHHVLKKLDAAGLEKARCIAEEAGGLEAFHRILVSNFRWPGTAPFAEWRRFPLVALKATLLTVLYPDPYAELFKRHPRPLGMGTEGPQSEGDRPRSSLR